MRTVFLILSTIIVLSGCQSLTIYERDEWRKYFKEMEKTHQPSTAFLLKKPIAVNPQKEDWDMYFKEMNEDYQEKTDSLLENQVVETPIIRKKER